MDNSSINGVHVHYYVVCKRKLWLFAKDIAMEQESDRVLEGKLLHERAYRYLESKEIMVDNQFKIDAIDGDYVREVKITSRMQEADRWQMLFYLYQLKRRGILKKGLISYPKEKKTEEVMLTPEDERTLEQMFRDIEKVMAMPAPPPAKRLRYCTRCAYYMFCFVAEREDE